MTTATTTAVPAVKLKPKEYRSAIEPTWCPGCGDYAVTAAICNALSANGVDPDNAVIVSGIGCSSRLPSGCGRSGSTPLTGGRSSSPWE